VIYVAYRIGKVLLRVFVGLTVLALVSWGSGNCSIPDFPDSEEQAWPPSPAPTAAPI
jgi:hypothetical protein